MYTYGITGTSINEFGDVTVSGVLDDQILQYNSSTGQWENVALVAGVSDLEDLGDVDIDALTLSDNDVLTYNSSTSQWENAAPAAVPSDLQSLTDVDAYATQQWPGPFTVTGGLGAPSDGTGAVGSYYIDGTNPVIGVLYGPKAASGTIWPLIGNQNSAWYAGLATPVDGLGWSNGVYYLQFTFTPPSTIGLVAIYGPYTTSAVSDRSYLGYDQATRSWKASAGEYLLATEGGAAKAAASSVSGNFGFNPNLSSYFEHTLTGTVNYNAFTPAITQPRFPSGDTRASHLVVALKQGGSGGYTVTWPSTLTWPGGVAPVLSTRVGDIDVFHLVSYDRGVSWSGVQIASGASRNNISSVATKTADYTITRVDMGNIVVLDGADNRDFTIPTNATMPVPVGSRFTVGTMAGGHLTLVGAAGVTLTGTATLNTAGQIAEVIKVAADTWITHH
jgi:hypothetical protein